LAARVRDPSQELVLFILTVDVGGDGLEDLLGVELRNIKAKLILLCELPALIACEDELSAIEKVESD
jgi:hypothetical protein